MKILLKSGPRSGEIFIPASKSQCHRLFICGALSKNESIINCGPVSEDIYATISCLNAMGADINEISHGIFSVKPIVNPPEHADLFCGESGSTLRFLMPIAGVFGIDAVFYPEGRLIERPLQDFASQLHRRGMEIKIDGGKIYCQGKLLPGTFYLPGDESSQYVSALLMSLPLLGGDSRLNIIGELQSKAYVAMTKDVLQLSGIKCSENPMGLLIPGNQIMALPAEIKAEEDYSSASFFLCAGALSEEGIIVKGLNPASCQGDREIINILLKIGAEVNVSDEGVFVRKKELNAIKVDASQIPDLVPPLAALLSLCRGESLIYNAGRLRLKESDRLKTCCEMLNTLGAQVKELSEGLKIIGRDKLSGGSCDSFNDHRIAMAAAVAACGCENAVEINNAEAVKKSYPDFWSDFQSLKGEI